jgi:hypothetical protein
MTYELLNSHGDIKINGYTVSFCGIYDDKLYYFFPFACNGNPYKTYHTRARFAAWVNQLHGNAPGGMFYCSFRIKLPDGSGATLRRYL